MEDYKKELEMQQLFKKYVKDIDRCNEQILLDMELALSSKSYAEDFIEGVEFWMKQRDFWTRYARIDGVYLV